jgi:hypothetical protein
VAERHVKYSFLLPVGLSEKIHKVCELHHLKPSNLFRQLIIGGIDAWLSSHPPRVISLTLDDPSALPIDLDPRIRPAVRLACELWGLDASGVLSMVLRDHLAAYIKVGKQRRDELEPLLAELEEEAPEPSGPSEEPTQGAPPEE